MVLDRSMRIRELVAFYDHIADALDYPAVDSTDVVVFQSQHATDLRKLLGMYDVVRTDPPAMLRVIAHCTYFTFLDIVVLLG